MKRLVDGTELRPMTCQFTQEEYLKLQALAAKAHAPSISRFLYETVCKSLGWTPRDISRSKDNIRRYVDKQIRVAEARKKKNG